MSPSVCVVGHGGCYVPPKETFVASNIDWLTNKHKLPEKNKGKRICMSDSDTVQVTQFQIGSFGASINVSQEGQFSYWASVPYHASENHEKIPS